ncbi:MAG: hypothetical protein WC373_04820 [Smithella sp.]
MLNYLYHPGTVARGHVERINKNSYLAVFNINGSNGKHDTVELHSIDPSHAKQKAEMFCEKLGLQSEISISSHIKAAFYDDIAIQPTEDNRVKPEFYRKAV